MIGRFDKWLGEGAGGMHYVWVVAPPLGAVSTCFCPVAIFGPNLCGGVVVHSTIPREGWETKDQCEYLEVPCSYEAGSMLGLRRVEELYDPDNLEPIYQWLESHLERLT